jgi:hypothetical protein
MTEAQIRSVFEAIKAEIGEREERLKGRLGKALQLTNARVGLKSNFFASL